MELNKIRIKNKKGAMGESIITIYRLVLVTIIGFFVLGVTAVAYGYYLDVKTKEAFILVDKVSDCIIDEGVVYVDNLESASLIEDCLGVDSDAAYIRLFFSDIYDEENNLISAIEIKKMTYGDSGLEWIKKLYNQGGEIDTENIQKDKPGRHIESFYANVNVEGITKLRLVRIEVFTRYDE